MPVTVCDMIMGAGKTTAAIARMNEDVGSRYIFITPFLEEVERIKKGCSGRNFVSPTNKGDGKLENLYDLLSKGCNISSTHALFRNYDDYILRLIKDGNYKLILDEVCDVIEHIDIHKHDIVILEKVGVIAIKDNIVYWTGDDCVDELGEIYAGNFRWIKQLAKNNNLIIYDDYMMLWVFPSEVFKVFSDVMVLTYKFNSQIQRCYFDMNNIDYIYIGTKHIGKNEYIFADNVEHSDNERTLVDHIHIIEDDILNFVGSKDYSLSVSWYLRESKKKDTPQLKRLKNNLINIYTNRFKTLTNVNMWTTYKDYKRNLSGKGYTTGFLSYNARSTNKYETKTHLAYCTNIYFNPFLKNYFKDHDISVDEDEYALSEMIQWIWRSAIRKGNDIWIYIPSKRMRELLTNWLDELANTK